MSINPEKRIVDSTIHEQALYLKQILGLDSVLYNSEWLTKSELKEYLRVKSSSTIDNWIKKGMIKKYMIGDTPRFNRPEIEKAIKGGKLNAKNLKIDPLKI